jgi:hypothetical protein
VRSMTEVARMTPTPSSTPATGEVKPTQPSGTRFLEYEDPALGGEWLYRLVAEDTAGNRSRPSEVMRARSLVAPPVGPTWKPPVRGTTAVTLEWTHPLPRLACNVERRPDSGGLWLSASGWLPRGQYTYEDTPPDLAAGWEYRLRVRDHEGQVASSMPTTTLTPLP